MLIDIVDHPLAAAASTQLRDRATDASGFRDAAERLVTLLGWHATSGLAVEPVPVTTPLAATTGVRLAGPAPLLVPVLRAGLGMLDALLRLLPQAEVGFVGMLRDEQTLVASTYATRLPVDLTGRPCIVLDPMLATGGTVAAVVQLLRARGAASVTVVCLLAAPEGIARLDGEFGDEVRLVVAAVDDGLDPRGYIVPGLGDAGDRLFGVAE